MINKLSKRDLDILAYKPPICEVILDVTQRVICESELVDETELVGDIDGEW